MRAQQVWSAALAEIIRGAGTVELLDRDREIRAPQVSCRRIGFIGQSFPEQGFLAGWVADRLARRRDGAVLAVDACASRACAGSGWFGTTLDLSADPAEPPTQAWARQIGPVARFFDAVVTDWGTPASWPEIGAIRAGSRALCVVVRAEPEPVDQAVALLRQPSLAVPSPDPDPATLTIVLAGPHAQARALTDRLRHQLPAELPVTIHRVPLRPDRMTGRSSGRAGCRLPRETRFALLSLTAGLMSDRTGSMSDQRSVR